MSTDSSMWPYLLQRSCRNFSSKTARVPGVIATPAAASIRVRRPTLSRHCWKGVKNPNIAQLSAIDWHMENFKYILSQGVNEKMVARPEQRFGWGRKPLELYLSATNPALVSRVPSADGPASSGWTPRNTNGCQPHVSCAIE